MRIQAEKNIKCEEIGDNKGLNSIGECNITIDMIDIIVNLLNEGNKLKHIVLGVYDIANLICNNCCDKNDMLEYQKIVDDATNIVKYIDDISNIKL